MWKIDFQKIYVYFIIFILLINIIKNETKIRRLDNDSDPVTLNIYFDLYSFYDGNPFQEYNSTFIDAMNKAKNYLEKLILIDIDPTGELEIDDGYKDLMGINWDPEKFIDGQKLNITENNYYIFFKYSELTDVDMISKIVITYTMDMPLIGLITINKNMDNSKFTPNYLTNLFLQQLIKLLGFHAPYDNGKADVNGPIQAEVGEEVEDEADLYDIRYEKLFIDSENVINYTKTYFDCDEIEEIELEKDNYNNVYWPSRKFLGDIMTKFDINQEDIVISKFTLLVLSELNYLHIENDYTGGLMRFGKHKGCTFFNQLCNTHNGFVFDNEFYLPDDTTKYPEPSCSSGRLGKTVYRLHPISTDIVPEYSKNGLTGLKQTNYCPIAEYEPSEGFYTGLCSNIDTQTDDNLHEELGNNSFCVLSSLFTNNFKSACYKMKCSSESLTIIVNNTYIICPREGGQIKPLGFEGYILCPDYNLICTGTGNELCNNLFDCIDKGSNEKNDTFNYEYTIKTTQNSNIYNGENIELSEGWEKADDGFCPKLCRQCDKNGKCIKCKSGYKIYDENENICHDIVPNCKEYEGDEDNLICKQCVNNNFFLAQEDDGTIICQENSKSDEYYNQTGLNYRIKCHKQYTNCYKCDSEMCKICKDNYKLIDDVENGIIFCSPNFKSNTKLSKGEIAAIAIGCFLFLLLIAGIIYFFIKKFGNKKEQVNKGKMETNGIHQNEEVNVFPQSKNNVIDNEK